MAEDGVSASAAVQSQGKPQTAIVIMCGSDSAKFRPATPSKEVLERVMLKWGQGMIVDHEGFVLTPSSPVMDPGRYEYQADLPSGFSSRLQLEKPNSIRTRQDHDRVMLEKAKADFKGKWQQLWSWLTRVSRKTV